MKSNGFGSWEQTIIIEVGKEHREAIAKKLGVLDAHSNDPSLAPIVWTRYTKSPRDDEAIIWELWLLLGELATKTDWQVDWEASSGVR